MLPSVINAKEEIRNFLDRGRINFPDEVVFGRALVKSSTIQMPALSKIKPQIETAGIRKIIDSAENGYLEPDKVQQILDAAGIRRVEERLIHSLGELEVAVSTIGFPLVMKVIGPVHKSDAGGVVLGIESMEDAENEYMKMMSISDASGVMLQPQISGLELFAGVKSEGDFGHLILFGMGGIFIEVLKDVMTGLVPLEEDEIKQMVKSLKAFPILQGTRGLEGIDLGNFEEIILRLSALVEAAPEIEELDLNPILATPQKVTAVDARIRLKS